jgi:hypothetical protein
MNYNAGNPRKTVKGFRDRGEGVPVAKKISRTHHEIWRQLGQPRHPRHGFPVPRGEVQVTQV